MQVEIKAATDPLRILKPTKVKIDVLKEITDQFPV